MQLDLPTDRMLASVDDDGVGWVVYNNPEKRNAMSSDMLAALPAIAQAFRSNDDVRVVVLRGAGDKAFVSGADLSELGRAGSSGFEIPSGSRGMYEAAGAGPLLSIEKPVIAMIQGACIGGGLLTALCADIRIAADALSMIPEIQAISGQLSEVD